MATFTVDPGGFGSAYSQAVDGDTIILNPGTHLTPSSGTARQSIAKRLTIQASSWDSGQFVTGANGHSLTDCPVVWQGGWAISVASVVFRGIAFEGRMTGGAGSVDVNHDDILFEDCRFSDGYRYIMVHIGSSRVCYRSTFRRCRFRAIGDRPAHDHPIYLKTARNALVEDSIFYENAGWAFHCYTDCDDLLVRRTVVDRSNGGVTFSGDSSNTVLGGYQYSTNNIVDYSIFTNAMGGGSQAWGSGSTSQTLYLAQAFYPSTAGTNYLRNSDFWMSTTPDQSGRIQSTSAITVESTVLNSDPKYANPTGGDFTLASDSPAIGMGPTQIQPGGSPPPPDPDPVIGENFGKTTIGGTWRGMSGDYKRASRYQVTSGKQITAIVAYLRGNGTSGVQSIRPFAYDDSGALLGVCTAQDISNTATAGWVTFTPASPIACPSNGGTVRLGLHTTSGDVQIATDVVTGGMVHTSDTYSDGTSDPWGTDNTDQYEMSIYALTENVAASADLAASGTLTFTGSAELTEVTPGSTAITDVVYRMVSVQLTYVIPTPFQVSTGAELEWDSANGKFIYKGSG